jgi:hypothetical protein
VNSPPRPAASRMRRTSARYGSSARDKYPAASRLIGALPVILRNRMYASANTRSPFSGATRAKYPTRNGN